MTRKIVVVLFLIVVLVLAVLVSPLVAVKAQSGPAANPVQGNTNSVSVYSGAIVTPHVLACAGCTGGGGGPG
jgi:hypothetical protein